MKFKYILLPILSVSFLMSCSASRLTVEDVNKKVEFAQEANMKALEKSKEAITAREQLTADYKATKIEMMDKRIKDIDKQIKSIKKSSKNAQNETAASSLGSAVTALESEKKDLEAKKKEINSIQSQNWQDNITKVDSAMNTINSNLKEVTNSMSNLK